MLMLQFCIPTLWFLHTLLALVLMLRPAPDQWPRRHFDPALTLRACALCITTTLNMSLTPFFH
jgi:hypothetical protein